MKKDDRVQVIAGREKGKSGKVVAVYPKSNRILIEKVNMVKRHVKPAQQNTQGGIQEKEIPVHASNVLLFCPKCNRGVRHGVKYTEAVAKGKKKAAATGEKKKARYCKKCEGVLDV